MGPTLVLDSRERENIVSPINIKSTRLFVVLNLLIVIHNQMASPTDTKSSITSQKYRDTHQLYEVVFGNTTIKTLVTRTPEIVDSWVRNMQRHENNINIIGLDIEWRSRSSIRDHTRPSILQLCTVQRSVGKKYFSPREGGGKDYKCLIFQIRHCDQVPQSIINYLGDKSCVFVSDRMTYIKEKLNEHYKLDMAYPVDISQFLEVEKPEKPNAVRDSDWDKKYLDPNQVHYACLDAYVSYEEASRFINTNKSHMQIPHGLSLDGMKKYLFAKPNPETLLVEEEDEEDYDMVVAIEVCDEEEDDYDVILHNEVYDV